MKADLDRLMQVNDLDFVAIIGDSDGNTAMNYLTGGIHLEGAVIVKKRGGPVTLVHGAMEHDSAAQTDCALINRDEKYNRYELLARHNGDRLAAEADFVAQILKDQNISGRVGIYGKMDVGEALALIGATEELLTDVEFVGQFGDSVFTLLRETKDHAELAELQKVGRLTGTIMGEVQAFIQQHLSRDGVLYRPDKQALTIGDVKIFLRERLSFHGLTDHNATIFSQGRDAAIPHNRGDEDAALRLGESIVFDLFPQSQSGYYHDMTRTWCLGFAPPEVQKAWDECKEILDRVTETLAVGQPCRESQETTCDYFEAAGHQTARSHPGTEEGYVHSLGHGLGLEIHEEPRLTHARNYNKLLQVGHVFSVEPGLYYPDRGYGIRIEDSFAFDADGTLINLTEYPYDLVIPIQDEG